MTAEASSVSSPVGTGSTPSVPPAMAGPLQVATLAHRMWIEIATETIRFACHRLQQDLRAQRAMLGCSDPQEWRRMQASFLKDTQAQYAAEAGRLIEMMAEATAFAWSVSAPARRHDDVPL